MKLQDYEAPLTVKLAALWASLMFCYIYADFFGLFVPGRLGDMNQGIINPLGPATPGVMLGVSIMLAVPALMIFAVLVMRPAVNRWANIVLGLVYAVIIALTMIGAPLFYLFFGAVEIGLSLLIIGHAWRWPAEA